MARDSLGNCVVCGEEASVLYPLLPGNPSFCPEHHNPESAGPFGCDFSGPDDFDIPVEEFYPKLQPQGLNRNTFIWTDKEGSRHPLRDIGDQYLKNIINYLERGEGHVFRESVDRRKQVIDFLKGEQKLRGDPNEQ